MARKEPEPPADPAPPASGSGGAGTAGQAGAAGRTGAASRPGDGLAARLARLARPRRAAQPPGPVKPHRPPAPAYWFPLVLFGVLSCAAAPLYPVAGGYPTGWTGYAPLQAPGGFFIFGRHIFGYLRGPVFLPGPPWLAGASFVLGWYWLEALVGGYLLTLAWYRRQARRAGTGMPGRAYRIAGIVLITAGLTLPLLWVTLSGFWQPTLLAALWMQGTVEFIVIAVGLWLFTSHDRSRSLVIVAAVYTAAAVAANLWQPAGLLPIVLLPGAVLLVAGISALLVRRRPRPAGPA